jgi:hypothetical protein
MTIDIDLTKYTEAELLELHRRIAERVRDLRQAATYHALAKFSVSDRVFFDAQDGRRIEGTIIRVSKKTVTVHTDDHHHWRVSPSFLKRAGHQGTFGPSNVVELRP